MLWRQRRRWSQTRNEEPTTPDPNVDGLDASELRRLADQIDAPLPEVDSDLETKRSGILAELAEAETPPRTMPWLAGGLIAAILGVGVALVLVPLGVVVGGAGLASVAAALWRRSAHRSRKLDLIGDLQIVEGRLGPDVQRASELRASRARAETRIDQLGLEVDPYELRRRADELADVVHAMERYDKWVAHVADLEAAAYTAGREFCERVIASDSGMDAGADSPRTLWDEYRRRCRQRSEQARIAAKAGDIALELERIEIERERVRNACESLVGALLSQGVEDVDVEDPTQAFEGYEKACKIRADQAEAARGREALGARLAARMQADNEYEAARALWQASLASLVKVAKECGLVPAESPGETAAELTTWLSDREESMQVLETRRAEWVEFQSLLNGQTVADLGSAAAEARRTANELTAALPTALEPDGRHVSEEELKRLRVETRSLAEAAAKLEGVVRERASRVASVPEAEEAVAAAERELGRVLQLQDTLTTTREFLQKAEERVHRTIAPLLKDSVESSLGLVTDDRYTSVRVDPDTLQVKVSADGVQWRDASQLSTGTAEQIYLLLRAAMVEHLAKDDEPCPLLLDDPTVNSDRTRTVALLEALHVMSRDRQIILFSQEDEVAAWARENMTDEQDSFQELAQLPAN